MSEINHEKRNESYLQANDEAIERGSALFDLITAESYYGFNMKLVLADLALTDPATFGEVEAVFRLVADERSKASERAKNRKSFG